MPDRAAGPTAQEIIALVTSTEFNRENPRVTDHDRVVVARVMASHEELRGSELDALEAWAEDLLSQPTVQVVLTEKERSRLRERLLETFAGDRGIALGFSEEDRVLALRFGIAVPAPDAEGRIETAALMLGRRLHASLGSFPVPAPREVLSEWVRIRVDARHHVEKVRTSARNLHQHYRGEPEPTVATAMEEIASAIEAIDRAYATLDRPDLEARGVTAERLSADLQAHIERYRQRVEARNEAARQRQRDSPMKLRYRLRRYADRANTTIPAPGRDAIEPAPVTEDEHARWARIESEARRLVHAQTGGLPPLDHAGLGEVLLHIEREILADYSPGPSFLGREMVLPGPIGAPARALLQGIRGMDLVILEPDRLVLRGILRWITNEAVCFRCRQLGRSCRCLDEIGESARQS